MKTLLGTLCSLLILIGCGGGVDDQAATVPVEGTIAYNGKAIEGAKVSFWTEKAPKAATGLTDAEGKFTLSMYSLNDGAMVGTHKITVTKDDPNAATTGGVSKADMDDPSKMADMMKQADEATETAKPLIPAGYATRSSTPLEETVTADGPNTFVIQLTD